MVQIIKYLINFSFVLLFITNCSFLSWDCDISIELVQTNALNPKITNKEDLFFLEIS